MRVASSATSILVPVGRPLPRTSGADRAPRTLLALLVAAVLASTPPAAHSGALDGWVGTVYGARISSEVGWEDILIDPVGAKYVDAYLVAVALARPYAAFRDGALVLEAEGQAVYNFGEQHHWEFNLVPIVARWQRFPWSHRVATSAAFGLGLSYATEVPDVEVEIEGQSEQWLVYWMAEVTAGPVDAPWAVTLRLHHRSVAYGLMGEKGGMNAVGFGLRYRF